MGSDHRVVGAIAAGPLHDAVQTDLRPDTPGGRGTSILLPPGVVGGLKNSHSMFCACSGRSAGKP
jgi:hypothetical protein